MTDMANYQGSSTETERETSLVDIGKELDEKCRGCKPLSAIACVTECKTWRLKNQLRKLHDKMQDPKFLEMLLNTLKNERRLQLLDMLSRQYLSISQVQKRLSSLGFKHSQQTIIEEYINPLAKVGLIQEGQNPYALTIFGCRVSRMLKDVQELEKALPPHSECYEEKALGSLLEGSKTYEEMSTVIPANNVARTLSRLQKSGLVQISEDKNYIFFFRTKRNPGLSKVSLTEKRVYENIPDEGISAKQLSEGTAISLRRTYKYVRKLKGKKLVFARKKPLTYPLTTKGSSLAITLKALCDLTAEAQVTTTNLVRREKADGSKMMDNGIAFRKDDGTIAVTNTGLTKHNQ
jgi:predicted transcriptional regulator